MSSPDSSNIIPVPSQAEAFPLSPFLDTLYRWVETQPWFEDEFDAAWRAYTKAAGKESTVLPDPQDPDEHDRLLRFWSWFTLDRATAKGERPIDAFVASVRKNLTEEGEAVYEGLRQTLYGVFRVQKVVPQRLAVLEDMAGSVRYHLNDKGLSSELQKGDLVVGRLYPYGDAYCADPDVHVGHVSEAPVDHAIDAPKAEGRYYTAMVPAKGAALDVIDALLMQIDSPLTADDVFEMIKAGPSLEAITEELYAGPAYKLRYLHLRDRSLLDELLQELWDTAGPMQEAELPPEQAAALTRTIRNALRAIAEGDVEALRALCDPKSYLLLYLDLYGLRGLQRMTDVTAGAPGAGVHAKHELLPKDGGIFTTLSWESQGSKHHAAVTAYGTPEGNWKLADLSLPETMAAPAQRMAFDRATNLPWATPQAPDPVEQHLRAAIKEVGYSVQDAADLFKLWRDFKDITDPDISQPAIWAAGLELADARYRIEAVEIKILAKSYGVMPRAIDDAATQIEEALKQAAEAESR